MADGATIAKAYVQIVPSTEGISGGIKDSLNGVSNEFETAGSKMGSLFAGALGGALGSAITSVISNAISAAGKLLKDSITSSAEFEQLKGGVESIFSGMDTSRIMSDAKNAYKDLGMSANDYLGTINDVGASFKATMGSEKGYDTARKGLKSISDYASGTGKNVGELTDKFSMITRSTSSYQSIADQFSGILPATSEAFLKQAQSAGDLSKSYKKLSEVPIGEYQQAVTNALEDGVAALNLTGNTAREAETTVSGSFSAMTAAWDNFVMSLTSADVDTSEMAHNLIEAFENVVTNLTPVLMEFGPAIAEALATAAIELAPAMQRLVNQIVIELIKKVPEIQARIKKAFLDVFMKALGEEDSSSIGTALGKIVKGAIKLCLDAVVTAYGGAWGNTFKSLFSIDKIKDKVNDIIKKLKEVGKNMVQGLIDGFTEMFEQIANKPVEKVEGMVDKVKDVLGIKSPSRVFRDEVGAMMARGLQIGFSSEMTKVNGNIEHDVNTTFDLASDDMFRTINRRPTSTPQSNVASEIARALGSLTIQNNVTLEGDARTLFSVIQDENRVFKNSTGRSAFA